VKQHLAFFFLKILPRNLLSRFVGELVSWHLPWPLNRISVSIFAHYYNINISEAEKKLSEYDNIQSLFTRRLKPGARHIESDLVHPADAQLTSHGLIRSDEVIQAKGITYRLSEFLGEDATRFIGGYYLTYYLCPTDYHRVHSPAQLTVERVRFIPGDLWPVNETSVRKVPRLFAINERVAAFGNGGRLAMVMVGATNVGKIKLSFLEGVSNNGGEIREVTLNPPRVLAPGEEFGVFHMGSTVVVLLDPSYLVKNVNSGTVRLGQAIPLGAAVELSH